MNRKHRKKKRPVSPIFMRTSARDICSAAFFTLLIAGGCTPQNTEKTKTDGTNVQSGAGEPVAAQVNGTKIFVSDVTLAAREQGLVEKSAGFDKKNENFDIVLNELIDQRLLAMDAKSRGLEADKEAKRRLAAAQERILGNLRIERHLAETVTDTAIRRMYDEQAKLAARGDEVRARHILVEDKTKADELHKALSTGGDFAALATEHSIDAGSADRGGDLGYFTQDMFDAEFSRPVFNTPKGETVGPLKSEFGWHVVQVLDRRPADQPSFETLKPQIENFMTFNAIESLLSDLRGDADVVIIDKASEAADDGTDEAPSQQTTGEK